MHEYGVHITTFGYDYGDPPKADRVYDVRDLSGDPLYRHEIEEKAEEIARDCESGEHIAIGCRLGHDRSPAVAKDVRRLKGGTIEHRDKHRNHHTVRVED